MQEATAVENFAVCEWIVENFSFWNSFFPEETITSPPFGHYCLEILPKCFYDKRIRVKLHTINLVSLSPGFYDLSYIASDGAVICTQDKVIENGRISFEVYFPPGPRIEEVVNQIQQENGRFTLRLRKRSSNGNTGRRIYSWLPHFDVTLRIPAKMLLSILSQNLHIISKIFPVVGDLQAAVFLTVFEEGDDDSSVRLALKPSQFQCHDYLLITTSMSVIVDEEERRSENNDKIFINNDRWEFSNSLTREELGIEGLSLVLRIKIFPASKWEDKNSGANSNFSGELEVAPLVVINNSRLMSSEVNSITDFSRSQSFM